MQRGSQTLFSHIFIETPTCEVADQPRKGRSADRDAARNACLVARYFYYGKFTQYRYGYIISLLSAEFFLSERTIQNVIDANYDRLVSLKKEQPERAYFKNKWPHLSWA